MPMLDQEKIETITQRLRKANSVTVLTGAGISAESGVPTFRASDGLWEGHPIQEVATPRGWYRNPENVWRFYHARRANVATVKPNPGHVALKQLEDRFGDGFTLITQNVDGLHQQAGCRNVLELHGALREVRCTKCQRVEDRGLEPLDLMPICTTCRANVRPNIVWFEEALPELIWSKSVDATVASDVFFVIGTSAVVYPAAGLIPMAKRYNPETLTVEINLTRTDASEMVDLGIYGKAGEILPIILRGI
jgi:NAD-dependent deacetylase